MLVLGAGQVGTRAARYAVETAGVARVLVGDRRPDAAASAAANAGAACTSRPWSPGAPIPDGAAAVACALPGPVAVAAAQASIAAGVPFVACADGDETISALLDLGDEAASAGAVVVAGAGLAPGLAEVLAVHAAGTFDIVDTARVARSGVAGKACGQAAAVARSGSVEEWVDGAWSRQRGGSGAELIWFPDPVGGAECARAASGDALLLVRCIEGLRTARSLAAGLPGAGGLLGALPMRLPSLRTRPWRLDDEAWAGVWVEVRGARAGRRDVVVYGGVDRMASAAGAVLAVTAAWLGGVDLPLGDRPSPGAYGLGEVVEPIGFLAELAERGVKAACFEGTAPA